MPLQPRKRPIDYILPFLIMICAGVIVVLGYQLYSTMNSADDEKDIYMYLAQGNSKYLPWGSGEWEEAFNGTRLYQGDSVKTQQGGRAVVGFFGDHFIRIDDRTEVSFTSIKESNGVYEVSMVLRDGNIWINSNENSETPVTFTVQTNHTLVKTVSTIFEVEQDDDEEIIRVMEGNLLVDILIDEDGKKVMVETIAIGVGQEAVITADDVEDYEDRKNPSVISALSDDFRDTAFYKWNKAEDKNPSDFSLKSGIIDPGMFEDDEEDDEDAESDLAAPEITVPTVLDFTTQESSLTIRGTTSTSTKKMMVDITSYGTSETYDLNLYVPGGTEWSFAVSEDADTLNSGENEYYFYAVDEEDKKGSKTKLIVTYEKEGDDDADDEEEDEDLDLGILTAPVVETFNGSTTNSVDSDPVIVIGSVSGAKEVVVNGYTLGAFEPGDTSWQYNAAESYGNLEDGENTYTVVAVGDDGSEKSTEFTIIYDKPEEEEPAEEEPTEDPIEDTPATDDPKI